MAPAAQPTTDPDRPNTAWHLTVRLSRRPYCPVCGHELQPTCTGYRDSIAVCEVCQHAHASVWAQILHCHADPELVQWWTTRCGLAHWTPTDYPVRDLLAFRRHVYDRVHHRPPSLHATSVAAPPLPSVH